MVAPVGALLALAGAFVSPRLATQAARRVSASPRARAFAAASPEWALLFDCDGVILESEALHREAYNAVFREFDAEGVHWSEEYYDVLQNTVGGGIPKMRYHFGENGWPTTKLGPPPETKEAQETLLNTLQDRKTQIYKDIIAGEAEARPNVLKVMDEAIASPEVAVAVCSASTKSACMFVLSSLLGEARISKLDFIAAGDDVERRKPDPEIYNVASERLGVPAERCLVVEDSLIGLQAADAASMRCIITTTPSTASQTFAGAAAVYPEMPADMDVARLRALLEGGSSGETVANFALGARFAPSRRALGGIALASALALGGDLLGITQATLSLAPGPARRARLDVLYPVGGFKRFVAPDSAYELMYPKAWLADQAAALPKPGDVRALDGELVPRSVQARQRGPQLDAAFGPAGGGRTENLSVLRTNLGRGLDMSSLFGSPEQAAQRLLDTSIAPAGSGKAATLEGARLRPDGVLQFEYTVRFDADGPMRGAVIKNEACVAYDARTGTLFTLTVLAPASKWADQRSGGMLRTVAPSFRLGARV